MTYFSFFSRFQKRLSAFSIATWTRRWSGPGRSPTCVGFDTFQCRADVDCMKFTTSHDNVAACSQVAATLYTLAKPQLDLRIVLGDKPSYIQVSNESMIKILGTFIKPLFTKAETIDLDTLQEVPPFVNTLNCKDI